MARKNVFALGDVQTTGEGTTDNPLADTRPLAGLDRPIKRTSPVGTISQSLGGISQKAQRADALEKQLAEGQSVVDLDPETIDSSFVVDRLGVSREDQQALVAQIREHGQQVPILVRPHPTADGRYQVAYGHRRLAAIREIGGTVRAVVRALSDDQLVISQGQENNARTDLSFIERSFFAAKLESRQFSRDTIMSALGVDKAALSRMIALVHRLPADVIEAIGAAPGFGRTRWADIADLMEDETKKGRALDLIQRSRFADMSSDERFQAVYDTLRDVKPKPQNSAWRTKRGVKAVRITETDERLNLTFDKLVEPDFGAFVRSKLNDLHDEFVQRTRG